MHILHNWGEWQYAGEIYGPTNGIESTQMFEESDLVLLGEYWEIGCQHGGCGKVKGRPVYGHA